MPEAVPSPEALLVLEGIGKRFGAHQALDGVSIAVAAGRVHALVGENGAGKSTLVKIISGVVQPDSGEIGLAGRAVRFATPSAASAAGIHLVHQELALLPHNSVTENVFLGQELAKGGRLDWGEMHRRARAAFDRLGVDIDVRRQVAELSTAHQQLVEIARAVVRDPRVIILDEPTAALPPADAERLFVVLRQLTQAGTAVIYISHRLDEIMELADDITVLKDGRHVGTRPAAEMDTAEIIRMMVGRSIENLFPPRRAAATGKPLLEIEGLVAPPQVLHASFSVERGAIVGIYGLEGHGQDDILSCIAGARRPLGGSLRIEGRAVPWNAVSTMIEHGIGFVPEDRKAEGLALDMSGRENIALPLLQRLSRFGWVQHSRERDLSTRAASVTGVRGSLDVPVRALSGGNQQKLLLARWIAAGTTLFLLNQPTRGVDVGSKAEIYALIRRLCDENGAAGLVVAREITELQGLCDRILVMSRGRLVAECSPHDSEESILAAAVGGDTALAS